MAKFSDYPPATNPADYDDDSTFLLQNPTGYTKLGNLADLRDSALSGDNIYTTNGMLTGGRIVNGGGYYFTIFNATDINLQTQTASLGIGADGVTINDSLNLPYVAKTANYTATASDHTIDATANSFTVTLPTAVGIAGRVYNIHNSGTGTVTVDADGTETIEGDLTQEVNQWENLQIQSNGTNWIVL